MSKYPTRRMEPLAHDVAVVAHLVTLVHARRNRDFHTASDAHHQLRRLGVLVKFPRSTTEGGRHG